MIQIMKVVKHFAVQRGVWKPRGDINFWMERLLRSFGRLLGKILDLNAHTYSDEEWWGELS
jgi:hypothetical protein